MDLAGLEKILGGRFEDRMLLLSAVTHRSYLNEVRSHPVPHNERLEFIGDAVIELVTTEHIYLNYNRPEGEMTNLRSAVVNFKYLAQVAHDLGIEPFILMSRGQTQDNGQARLVILANCFEAIIGATYLDRGYGACRDFISRHVLVGLTKVVNNLAAHDPKGVLQEKVQASLHKTPTYRILKETGPDHAKEFQAGVFVGNLQLGQGTGQSKREAEISAARNALRSELYKRVRSRPVQ